MNDNYPMDIRQHDHHPQSPFYVELEDCEDDREDDYSESRLREEEE
jgi:hypothetical protein